jgi:hypothetical protein
VKDAWKNFFVKTSEGAWSYLDFGLVVSGDNREQISVI